jgi:hypothetical protein
MIRIQDSTGDEVGMVECGFAPIGVESFALQFSFFVKTLSSF